ncbi:MAG: ATP-dependent DNA helicase [Cryobacterium sp.]|nr:ATP-dependent DNA helicase [Oligoflexia bacterium]
MWGEACFRSTPKWKFGSAPARAWHRGPSRRNVDRRKFCATSGYEFEALLSDCKEEPQIIRLSIRDFALPSPRTGSIDAYSGFGATSLEGIEIHQQVQKKRAGEFPNYRSEVKLSKTFEREGYRFQIEGRMDGIFESPTPKIEEIKSTFNIRELLRTVEDCHTTHPYALQLLTYGYFYWTEQNVLPELTFHFVSTRNRETLDLALPFDRSTYEAWLERRLTELAQDAKRAEKRTSRRKKMADAFPFPFLKPRSGQIELIQTIEEGMAKSQRMLLQAPTGLGKTVGVLYPSLKEALSRGQRVVYVTPKNSQHAVAEDAVDRFQDTGSAVKSLTITAKSKMCFKPEPLCNPRYCEYAKDYYDKVAENGLVAELSKKKKLTARVFRTMGEKYEVCPFELQLEAAGEADVVICDYNYVFAPQSALGRLPPSTFATKGKPNLVVDEAHNLPSRAAGYYSPALSSFVLERMREDLRALPRRFAKEAEELLDEALEVISDLRPAGAAKSVRFEAELTPFAEQDGKFRGFLSRYLDSDVEIQAKDPVLRICFYWGEFTSILADIHGAGREEFFTTFQPERSGGSVKITCCDASQMLKPQYDFYDQVVAFSATLKPFDFYARLSGLDSPELLTGEFDSPFASSQRKLLIIPQISTKYSDRERNYSRIAETITRISALHPGNHLAFFPSFEFLERVADLFIPPNGQTLIRQTRGMTGEAVEEVLHVLRERARPTTLFAVQGGVFSEGVDYPGEMVIGAFIVGPPLPSFDIERESMKIYYEEHYGDGFAYAYTYPAMAKAVQAAGRVIRSETDRGIIVLMDSRFMEKSYSQSMPSDWFQESPRELVSRSILKDISDFWSGGKD